MMKTVRIPYSEFWPEVYGEIISECSQSITVLYKGRIGIYRKIQESGWLYKFSIQVNYDTRDDLGRKFRARIIFQTEANNIPSAYKNAETILVERPDATFGACLNGWHERF